MWESKKGFRFYFLLFFFICMSLSQILEEQEQKQNKKIDGVYQVLRIPSIKLFNPIYVTLSNSLMRAKGCNQIWAGFSYNDADSTWGINSQFSSTFMTCQNDQDQSLMIAMQKTVKVIKKNNILIFLNADEQQTMSLRPTNLRVSQPVKQLVSNNNLIPSDILGKYRLISINRRRPQTNVSFILQQNTIFFEGCDKFRAIYSYDPRAKTWQVSNIRNLTKIVCNINPDASIIFALQDTAKASRKGSQLTFIGRDGIETLRMTSTGPNLPQNIRIDNKDNIQIIQSKIKPRIVLEGNYQVAEIQNQKINTQLIITFQSPNITISGCNLLWATYVFDSNTQFWSVEQFSSIKKNCINDAQTKIVNALRKAIQVTKMGNMIEFINDKGKKLIAFKSSLKNVRKIQKPPLPKPPGPGPSPVRPVIQIFSGKSKILGKYQIQKVLSKEYEKKIQLNIDGKKIQFVGCNVVQRNYTYEQRTKKISFLGDFIQTQLFCQDNQDDFLKNVMIKADTLQRIGQYLIFRNQQGEELIKALFKSPPNFQSEQRGENGLQQPQINNNENQNEEEEKL